VLRLALQGCSHPCCSLRVCPGGWGQPRQPLCAFPHLSELLDFSRCPQHRGHCRCPPTPPSTPWPPLCRGLRKVGEQPQVPFTLQRLTPSCYLHHPSGKELSLWIHHPPPAPQLGKGHSARKRCTSPPQRKERWPLVPSRALSEAVLWGRGWPPRPRV